MTFFLPAQDKNCKRVVRVQCLELCRLPYTLMLLMVYCIRKTRASLVAINRGAHVVEEKSQGQEEGKQQVVAKTRGLDDSEHHSTANFLVASREYLCGNVLVGRRQSQTHLACTWTRNANGNDFHKHRHFERMGEVYHGVVPPLSAAHHLCNFGRSTRL